jgi:hypothetical protein
MKLSAKFRWTPHFFLRCVGENSMRITLLDHGYSDCLFWCTFVGISWLLTNSWFKLPLMIKIMLNKHNENPHMCWLD